MNEKDLKKFKKRLENLRNEILKVINKEEQSNNDALDEIDKATQLIEEEMGNLMSNNFYNNLKLVDEALERINKGEYGICQRCGEPIPIRRLEVLPFALYCVKCQEEIEQEEY